MKRILLPLILIFALLLTGCGGDTADDWERVRPTEEPTVAEALAMPDDQLAYLYSWIDLTVKDGGYSLDSSNYSLGSAKPPDARQSDK